MILSWSAYVLTRNPGVVDVGWVFAIAMVGVVSFFQLRSPSFVQVLLFILLIVWAIRLGGFLFVTRILPAHIDGRYLEIKNSFSANETFNFFLNYQLQALLATGVAFCLFFVFKNNTHYEWCVWLAAVLIVAGLIGEALADYQLYAFKQSGNLGVCDVGFWQYSRHPNYFFEIVVWLGFAVAGFGVSGCLLGFLSPLLLWGIMYYITVPLTERVSLEKRTEYREYMKNTNIFVPFIFK